MVDPSVSKCANCSAPIASPLTGRPRIYCSQACRQAALRRRQGSKPRPKREPRSSEIKTAVIVSAVPAPNAEERHKEFVLTLARIVGAEHLGSDNMSVAQAISDLKSLAHRFERLGIETRPEWAWRCSSLAHNLIDALQESFGDI